MRIMYEFQLQHALMTNEEVLENYVDVYIHAEDNSIVEGHMVILAQQSPFCHRFFQSRKKLKEADMFFTNIRHSVIKNAVRIIYGKLVNVSESDAKRVSSFLKMLQVQFKMVSLTENTLESMSSDSEQVVEKFCKNLDVAGKAEEIVAEPTETATTAHHEPMQDISCDWTQTTTDWDRVESIGHTLERDQASNKKMYKCKYCPVASQSITYAEKHFRNKHQDLQAERDLLVKVQNERSRAMNNFKELNKGGLNKALVEHESGEILEKLQYMARELEDLKTVLPGHLDFKKKDLFRIMTADIHSVKIFINSIMMNKGGN
jgi:hypothetical protein